MVNAFAVHAVHGAICEVMRLLIECVFVGGTRRNSKIRCGNDPYTARALSEGTDCQRSFEMLRDMATRSPKTGMDTSCATGLLFDRFSSVGMGSLLMDKGITTTPGYENTVLVNSTLDEGRDEMKHFIHE